MVLDRKRQDETGAGNLAARIQHVLSLQRAAMGLGDLAGDGETETRILAEILSLRPVGVEAFEDAVDVFGLNARSIVLDIDDAAAAGPGQAQDDASAMVGNKRPGI